MRIADSIALPNSIVLRTSLLFSLLTAMVILLMGIVVRVSVDHHFADMDRMQMKGKLELIEHILSEQADSVQTMTQQLNDALVGHHDLVVRINDASNVTVFSAGHDSVPDAVMTTPSNIFTDWAAAEALQYRGMVATMKNGYKIAVGTDISHHQMYLQKFEQQLLWIGACGSLAMAILGWFAAKRGLRPVQDMTLIASRISAEQLQERLSATHIPVELLTLADSFNAMLDRLSDSLQRLSDFSSDIAHELRTPINNLMIQTQVSLSKQRADDEYRENLYANLEEYERLARMIADMLFLAKADHGLVIPNAEIVNLHAEFSALCEFYEAVAAEKSVGFSIDGEASIHGDRLMLHRAFGNLLENAIRHSYAGNSVSICMQMDNAFATITIKNIGDVVSPEQLPRLFDRFYRSDASRQRNDEGAGLGLAITQSIIKAHGGSISASCNNGVTTFCLSLRVNK